MSLSSGVEALAARVAQVMNTKSDEGHVHSASDIDSGTLSPLRLPKVPFRVSTGSTAAGASFPLNAALSSEPVLVRTVITGSTSAPVTVPTPSGTPSDGHVFKVTFTAGGTGAKAVSFDAAFRVTSGLTRSYDIPNGEALMSAFEYVADLGDWVLIAATVTES